MRLKNGKCIVLAVASSFLLTACAGSDYSDSYESYSFDEEIVELEDEDNSITIALDENMEEEAIRYIKMGTISTDSILDQRMWIQYEYDDNGVLCKAREYDADAVEGCYEHIYDINGNETKTNWVEADGNILPMYSFEYDENGNVITEIVYDYEGKESIISYENETDVQGNVISRSTYNNSGEIVAKRTYEYHENNIVKKETRYLPDGTLQEELLYDEHGNMLDDKYYQDGELYIQSSFEYEYDDKGNRTKSISLSITPQRVVTYKNYYDEQDNLIKVETYENDGSISQIQEYAYMEFDKNKLVCSLDETYAIIKGTVLTEGKAGKAGDEIISDYVGNGTIVYEVKGEVQNSDFEVERFIKLLELDLTQFTFGQYGKYFMTLQKVIFEETGVLDGRTYCNVRLEYDSDYGKFVYWGMVFYETNLNGIQVITDSKINGNLVENPDVDWIKENEQLYADSFDTCEYYYLYHDDGSIDRSQYYHFVDSRPTDGVGFVTKVNGLGENKGDFTMTPSSVEGFEFEFRICSVDTGLCTIYYVNTMNVLLDPEDTNPAKVLQLYYFDQYKGIIEEPIWIICP